MIDRPKFKEMTYEEFRGYDQNWPSCVERYGKFDTVELQRDGIYVLPSPEESEILIESL